MKASIRDRRSVSGFTLIELLTVIMIIGILMGLILGVATFAQRKNLEARAKADIEQICTALTDYMMDIGELPPMASWTTELTSRGFLEPDFEFVDPWGTPYRYIYDDAADPPSQTYQLISLGEDGQGDAGDPEETRADNLEAGRY